MDLLSFKTRGAEGPPWKALGFKDFGVWDLGFSGLVLRVLGCTDFGQSVLACGTSPEVLAQHKPM